MNENNQQNQAVHNEKYDSVIVKVTKENNKHLSISMLVDDNSLFRLEMEESNNEYSRLCLFRKSEDNEYECIIKGLYVNTAYLVCIIFKNNNISLKCEHISVEKKIDRNIFKGKYLLKTNTDAFDYVRLTNDSMFKIFIGFENSTDVKTVFRNGKFIKENMFSAVNMNIKSVKIKFDDNACVDDLYRFISDVSSVLWSGQSSLVRDYLHKFKYDIKISSAIIDSNSIMIENKNGYESMTINDSIPFIVMTRIFNAYNIDFVTGINMNNIKTITVRNF